MLKTVMTSLRTLVTPVLMSPPMFVGKIHIVMRVSQALLTIIHKRTLTLKSICSKKRPIHHVVQLKKRSKPQITAS